jgi:diacylglycerol kinase family enzyme
MALGMAELWRGLCWQPLCVRERRMRITLFNNAKAGTSKRSSELKQAFERHGHHLVIALEKGVDVRPDYLEGIDLVVAAGGDGTIARAAKALAGHDVPLAILPLGTANNIAESLGVAGELDEMIDRWKEARHVRFDIGVVRGPWGEREFLESVGGVLVAAGIKSDRRDHDEEDLPREERVHLGVRGFLDVLSSLTPRRWTLILDGARQQGEFLLVEALNIRSIGSNLVFAAEADPSDGWLTVVAAGEDDREHIAKYLQCRAEGWEVPADLPSRRARRVEMVGDDDLHIDDEAVEPPPGRRIVAGLKPKGIEVLV